MIEVSAQWLMASGQLTANEVKSLSSINPENVANLAKSENPENPLILINRGSDNFQLNTERLKFIDEISRLIFELKEEFPKLAMYLSKARDNFSANQENIPIKNLMNLLIQIQQNLNKPEAAETVKNLVNEIVKILQPPSTEAPPEYKLVLALSKNDFISANIAAKNIVQTAISGSQTIPQQIQVPQKAQILQQTQISQQIQTPQQIQVQQQTQTPQQVQIPQQTQIPQQIQIPQAATTTMQTFQTILNALQELKELGIPIELKNAPLKELETVVLQKTGIEIDQNFPNIRNLQNFFYEKPTYATISLLPANQTVHFENVANVVEIPLPKNFPVQKIFSNILQTPPPPLEAQGRMQYAPTPQPQPQPQPQPPQQTIPLPPQQSQPIPQPQQQTVPPLPQQSQPVPQPLEVQGRMQYAPTSQPQQSQSIPPPPISPQSQLPPIIPQQNVPLPPQETQGRMQYAPTPQPSPQPITPQPQQTTPPPTMPQKIEMAFSLHQITPPSQNTTQPAPKFILQPWPVSTLIPKEERNFWLKTDLPLTPQILNIRETILSSGKLPENPEIVKLFANNLHEMSLQTEPGTYISKEQANLLWRVVQLQTPNSQLSTLNSQLLKYQAAGNYEGELFKNLPEPVKRELQRELPAGKTWQPEILQKAVEKVLEKYTEQEPQQLNKANQNEHTAKHSEEIKQILQHLKEQIQWTRIDQDTRVQNDKENIFYFMHEGNLQKGRLKIKDERKGSSKKQQASSISFSIETKTKNLGDVHADLTLSKRVLNIRLQDSVGTASEAVRVEREGLAKELADIGITLGELLYGKIPKVRTLPINKPDEKKNSGLDVRA
jgi:hypothetical protein